MDTPVKIVGPAFSTFVRSVLIACEEKGIPYEVNPEVSGKRLSFGDKELFDFHPYGKVPVLITEFGNISETSSIIRYLDSLNDNNKLYPADAFDKALVDQWSALISVYIDQAIVRNLLLEYAFPKGENGSVRMDKVQEALPGVLKALSVVNTQVEGTDYICGERLSAADLVLIPMLDYLQKTPDGAGLVEGYPAVSGYLSRVKERVSVAKVLAVS